MDVIRKGQSQVLGKMTVHFGKLLEELNKHSPSMHLRNLLLQHGEENALMENIIVYTS